MIRKQIYWAALAILPFSSFAQESASTIAAKLKSLSMEQLMDIEVTSASKRPEKLNQTASAIQVITNEDIRNSGATTLPEALRLAANLQVAQVNSSQWAISARGFNNVLANKLLVLIDGRVVYTPLYAGVFWDIQNYVLEDIERIEVITGPRSTEWGANAVNGVINIITKNSNETSGLFAEAIVGTETRGLGSLRYGGKINEKLSYRVYGSGFKKDNSIYPDSIDANDYWSMFQGGIRADYTSSRDVLAVMGNYYEGRPHADGLEPAIARGDNIVARWNHVYSEHSQTQLQVFHDHTFRDFRNGLGDRLRTIDIEGQHTLTLKNHNMIYGLNARSMDHQFTNTDLRGFDPANRTLQLWNVFFQDELQLIENKFYVSPGFRLEHQTYSGFQFQPTLRMRWQANEATTLWASAARAIRNPVRLDRDFFANIAPGVPFIVKSDFKPEEVIAYELGVKGDVLKKMIFSLSTFYNSYDGIRGIEPVNSAPIPLNFANVVEGNTYGAEVLVTTEINKWWQLRAGYTYLQKDLRVKAGRKDSNNASAESNDPKNQFLLQSTITPAKKIALGSVIRYVDALPNPKVSEYVQLDLRLSFNVSDKIELSVVGQNLIKGSHAEFIPSSPAAKHIERSVYGKIAASF